MPLQNRVTPLGELTATPERAPDGAFVMFDGEPHVVLSSELLRWSPAGYTTRHARPAGSAPAVVITPPSLVALLRTDRTPLVPLLHPSAVL